ncbi:PREDICTED: zinc finger BED domain-containing protein 1-like [Polistes canadensis]|uniref:zinc finger BED domain-containing protein 1-like n=1 Tax=Polistes canadensis TaxID=91411 RepID=UPI000718E170|nr:PREDICTED: zinc finger BED domain-containing protein 1-like [Polistes canadensis]
METRSSTACNTSKSTASDESKSEMQMVLAKMMEEKHTFAYKKLVVPMSMRSIYWKFFGFPATEDGDILTKVKIVCILCKTQIAYNRNTSNLRMHLQNKHAQELLELEASTPPRRQVLSQEAKDRRAQKRKIKAELSSPQHIYTTTADGTVQIDGDIQFVTDPNINLSNMEDDITLAQPLRVMIKGSTNIGNNNQNVAFLMPEDNSVHQLSIDGKTLSDAIAEFIIMDLQLPEVVEGHGFQRLVATLRSPCEIPSKKKLEEEIIPKIYDTFRESVTASFACMNNDVGLTIEEWKSNFNESFVTISVYYQNAGETTLECKVLNSLHAPLDWDKDQWCNVIDTLLHEWYLKIERITAVVVGTSRPELIAALVAKGLTLVPCLLHTLQVCAQACFENAEVANILSKCRTIIGAIPNHQASMAITMQEQEMEFEEKFIVIDYPGVWTSTYNMMEQIVHRHNIISSILDNLESNEQETIGLSPEEWRVVEDLVNVLEPFKVTIMTLSEEKMPLISLLRPLLWQLVSSHLKVKESDSDIARSFKESLSDMLCERYADYNVTLLLQIATSLDPRFKQLPYASDEDKGLVATPIKEMLTKLIQSENGDLIKIEEEQMCKKSRLSGMELLLGSLCATKNGMPAEEKADLELVQYQSESTAPLDYCPLQWWAKVSAKCPNLAKLACRYNCVPACCAPPARIPAEVQVLYDTRRAALPSHLVDKLLFLHGNHTV